MWARERRSVHPKENRLRLASVQSELGIEIESVIGDSDMCDGRGKIG